MPNARDPKRPLVSAIVAMAENRVIGLNNQLPWHLPADLKHFKTITTGHPILMGRKTYESIGRPLPNRTNFVMTRDSHFQAPGCVVVASLEEAIQKALPLSSTELFIIGGATVYQQALPLIQRLYLTVVDQSFTGDAFFPDLDKSEWKEIAHEEHLADEQNPFGYRFLVWSRIEK